MSVRVVSREPNTGKSQVVQSSPPNPATGRSATQTVSHDEQTSTSTTVTFRTVVTDDAGGCFMQSGADGLIDYAGKQFTLKVRREGSSSAYNSDYATASTSESWVGGNSQSQAASQRSGEWGSTTQTYAFAGGAVRVRYRPAGNAPTVKTHTFTPPPVVIDLCPYTTDRIIPGSVQFTWLGHVYRDYDGALYRDGTGSTPGILAGSIDYNAGLATLTDYGVSGSGFSLDMLWTSPGDWKTARLFGRTAGAPVIPGGFTISVLDWTGEQLIATANASGFISGPHCEGFIEFQTGSYQLSYGDWIDDASLSPEEKADYWYDANNIRVADGKIWKPWAVDPMTFRYNAVIYVYLPLPKNILGMDPVRLPPDGRVPFIYVGSVGVLHNTQTTDLGTADTPVILRPRLSYCHVYDATGERVPEDRLDLDLDTGSVEVIDPTGFIAPFAAEHRIEDMRMVTDVEIGGRVQVHPPLTHDFPDAGQTYFSTALLYGDLQAAVGVAWDQATWTNVWSDAQIGNAAGGTYNQIDYPIETTNAGAVQERWRLQFATPNTVHVIGEYLGQVLTNVSIAEPIAPINPTSGAPYFTIDPAGWGGGWSTGNVLRFNTRAANRPLWITRTVLASDERTESDQFRIQIRGDA